MAAYRAAEEFRLPIAPLILCCSAGGCTPGALICLNRAAAAGKSERIFVTVEMRNYTLYAVRLGNGENCSLKTGIYYGFDWSVCVPECGLGERRIWSGCASGRAEEVCARNIQVAVSYTHLTLPTKA